MPTIKLELIPKQTSNTQVIDWSANLNGRPYLDGALMKPGGGDLDYLCGGCGYVLLKSFRSTYMIDPVVYVCPGCKAHNRVNGSEREEVRPTMFNALGPHCTDEQWEAIRAKLERVLREHEPLLWLIAKNNQVACVIMEPKGTAVDVARYLGWVEGVSVFTLTPEQCRDTVRESGDPGWESWFKPTKSGKMRVFAVVDQGALLLTHSPERGFWIDITGPSA